MGRRIDLGRPRDGVAGSIGPDDRDVVGAIGKKRAMPSGRSETLADLPYVLGVRTGLEVLLSCTLAQNVRQTFDASFNHELT